MQETLRESIAAIFSVNIHNIVINLWRDSKFNAKRYLPWDIFCQQLQLIPNAIALTGDGADGVEHSKHGDLSMDFGILQTVS